MGLLCECPPNKNPQQTVDVWNPSKLTFIAHPVAESLQKKIALANRCFETSPVFAMFKVDIHREPCFKWTSHYPENNYLFNSFEKGAHIRRRWSKKIMNFEPSKRPHKCWRNHKQSWFRPKNDDNNEDDDDDYDLVNQGKRSVQIENMPKVNLKTLDTNTLDTPFRT